MTDEFVVWMENAIMVGEKTTHKLFREQTHLHVTGVWQIEAGPWSMSVYMLSARCDFLLCVASHRVTRPAAFEAAVRFGAEFLKDLLLIQTCDDIVTYGEVLSR